MLITNSIESLLEEDDNDVLWRYGNKEIAYQYLQAINFLCDKRDITKPNGGVLFFKKSVKEKIKSGKVATGECFDVLLDLFDKKLLNTVAQSDEIPFSIIQKKYSLKSKNSKGIVNVFPGEVDAGTLIIHTPLDLKFWQNPVSFYIYQEWFVNHKVWVNKYSTGEKIDQNIVNFETTSSFYYNKILYGEFFDLIRKDITLFLQNYFNKFYLVQERNSLLIKFDGFKEFYSISISTWAPIKHWSYQIMLVVEGGVNDALKIKYALDKNDYEIKPYDSNAVSICKLADKMGCDKYQIICDFKFFALRTARILDCNRGNVNKILKHDALMLLTYHKEVVGINISDKKIVCGNEVGERLLVSIEDSILYLYLFINNIKYYINSIDRSGSFEVAPYKQGFVFNEYSGGMAITVGGKFLSAKRDHSVTLVDAVNSWELFFLF